VAKTVPLDAPTLGWARGLFARYYQQEEVPPPVRLARRHHAEATGGVCLSHLCPQGDMLGTAQRQGAMPCPR